MQSRENLLKSKYLVNGRSGKAIIYYREGTKSVGSYREMCSLSISGLKYLSECRSFKLSEYRVIWI